MSTQQNTPKEHKLISKYAITVFWPTFIFILFLTIALIFLILWLFLTLNVDQLYIRVSIIACIVTIISVPLIFFFTIFKRPEKEQQAKSNPSPSALTSNTSTILVTTNELQPTTNQQKNLKGQTSIKQLINADQEQSTTRQEGSLIERHPSFTVYDSTIIVKNQELSTNNKIHDLYLEGLKFLSQNDLENALSNFQKVLRHDKNYNNGKLFSRMRKLLYKQAMQAHDAGNWDQEINAWKVLLELDHSNKRAISRLRIAEENQRFQPMYMDSWQLFNEGDQQAARRHLKELWNAAPYFGDPKDLAAKLGMKGPLNPKTFKKMLIATLEMLIATSKMLIATSKMLIAKFLPGFLGISMLIFLIVYFAIAVLQPQPSYPRGSNDYITQSALHNLFSTILVVLILLLIFIVSWFVRQFLDL